MQPVSQESPHDTHPPRPHQDRSSGHRSPADGRSRVRGPGHGLLAAAGSRSGDAAGLAGTAGLLDRLVVQLARAVADELEARGLTSAAPPALPALFDRRELAQQLGCGVDLIDRLRREGMPEIRLGDAPRFEIENVLSWLRSRGQAASGAA